MRRAISVQAVLEVVGEFDDSGGASVGLVAWELCIDERLVLGAWERARLAGLVLPPVTTNTSSCGGSRTRAGRGTAASARALESAGWLGRCVVWAGQSCRSAILAYRARPWGKVALPRAVGPIDGASRRARSACPVTECGMALNAGEGLGSGC